MDFSGADFSNANFHNADLSGSNLSGANLSNVNLDGALLKETNLISSTGIVANDLLKAKEYGTAELQSIDEFLSQIDQACLGYEIPIAYDGKEGFHPVAIRWEGQYYVIPDTVPFWIGIIDLVACVQSENVIVQNCSNYYYSGTSTRGPDLQRIRIDRVVSLYKVLTGRLIERKTFEGSEPRACKNTEEIPEGWNSNTPFTIFGTLADENEIWDWIGTYSDSRNPNW
jgi:hypothetical protein